jgi:hypothetical protein
MCTPPVQIEKHRYPAIERTLSVLATVYLIGIHAGGRFLDIIKVVAMAKEAHLIQVYWVVELTHEQENTRLIFSWLIF